MKKVFGIVFLVLSLVFSSLFVSCPNRGIGGSVERDSRNNTRLYVKGTINQPLTDSRKFTVTLNNATFRAYSRGEDVSSWFVDENGEAFTIDGLKYRIASPVARGSNKATIRITGTPTEASKDQIHLLIPCDTFQGPININVDTEDALFYDIMDYVAPSLSLVVEDGNDMVVRGMETKAFTKTIKFKLDHGYFATDTSAYDLEIKKDSANGDGSIKNTKTGGIYLDTPGSGEGLTYKWSAITPPSDAEAEPITEISLIISGTPQQQRKDETFKVTLKSKYYGTIIDDRGEEFTDDLQINATGEYLFTEVVPTLTLVSSRGSSTPLLDAKITGNADESLDFETQYLYFRLSDGKLNFYSATLSDTDTEITYTKKPDANTDKVMVKRSDFFTDDYDGKGLIYQISSSGSGISDGTAYQNIIVTVSHSKVTDNTSEKLAVYKKDHKFTIPQNLILKTINGTDTIYDKAVISSGTIAFNIEEPKPVVNKPTSSQEGIFFTGVVTNPISSTMITGSKDSTGADVTTENGGTITLKNANSFRFKSSLATGTEVEIKSDNTDVVIEPRYDKYMRYYYKIVPSSEDSTLGSIKLYVTASTNTDSDGDPEAPVSDDITYEKNTSSGSVDTATRAPGRFDDDKKAKYEVKVTLSKDLFETFKAADAQTQADDEPKGEWVAYEGSPVVIAPESHLIRYRIMQKETISIAAPAPSSSFVTYTRGDDTYKVDYINRGSYSYGVDWQQLLGSTGLSDVQTWYLVPGALPTSNIGTLIGIDATSTGVFDRLYGKFNTPVNYNMLKYIDANPSTVDKNNQNSIKDILYGMDGSDYPRLSGSFVPNSAFNRFTLVAALPDGYSLADDITSNDVRIFGAYKSYDDWNEEVHGTRRYDSPAIKTINDNLKFMLATDDGKLSEVGDATPLYIYVDSLSDDNSALTSVLYRGNFSGPQDRDKNRYIAQIAYPDIRINPSKIKDANGPLLTKNKAEKTKDGTQYDGDVGNLANADLWIPVVSSKLEIFITPVSGKSLVYDEDTKTDVEYNLAPLSWQYRIMDRADYTYVSPLFASNEKTQYLKDADYSDFWSIYGIYRHTPQSLSVNADMTTGVTKTTGAALTKDYKGVSHKYLDTKMDDSKLHLLVKADVEGVSGNKDDYREFYIDGESIPVRELKSGVLPTQTVYDKNHLPTIPASDLLAIVQSAKRKGYRPAGFARGFNVGTYTTYKGYFYSDINYTRSVYSDLIPYKGVDDFGDSVDWSIQYDDAGGLKTDSGILKDGIHLQLSDARAYRPYVDPERSSGKQYYTDWNNTTYIYLVWEVDPNSGYYDKEHSKVVAIDRDQNGTQLTKPMKFVTIPGDLNWLGFRNPYVPGNSYNQAVDFSSNSTLLTSGLGKEFSYFGKIADNDFAIADIEMTGELFKTVYDWGIANGYNFSNNSEEVYYSVIKNPYDYTTNGNNSNVLTLEKNSFNVSQIYGGKRPHTDASRKYTSGSESTSYWSTSGTWYTNVDSDNLSHPVTNVNIYDAMLFCNALTEWYNDVYHMNLTPAYSSTADGVMRTYSTIKNLMGTSISTERIEASQGKNGFRLPSYNEWFAAATIVPVVNNFFANAALNENEKNWYSGTNYYENRGIVSTTGVLERSTSGSSQYQRSSYAGYQTFDTSYPFMQNLRSVSGVTEESSYLSGVTYTTSNDNNYARFAHTNKDFTTTPMKESTVAVGTLLPNGLGLYDMSANVSEWTLGTTGKDSFFAVAGGDFAGSEQGSLMQNEKKVNKADYMVSIPDSVDLGSNKSVLKEYGGHNRIYTDGFYYFTKSYQNFVDTKAESSLSSTGSPSGNIATLNINQRSRNVGFRVCRTVLPNEN